MLAEHKRVPSSLALYGGVGSATRDTERRLFSALRLPNGTYKTTYRDRLDDVNEAILTSLPSKPCLDVMDVAVSSGVSTIEWSDHMQAHGVQHSMVAGDLVTDAWLTSWGRWVALLVDGTGQEPLLLEIGPLMFPLRSDRWLARAARPWLLPVLRRVAALGRPVSAERSSRRTRGLRLAHRSVSLVSPELHHRPSIALVQDDITISGHFPEAFDVIRVANLVQRVYFNDHTLKIIVNNLRDRLREGGILIICRTMDDGVNHGTIFRRVQGRLMAEQSINSGADVCDLVLAASRESD